MKQKEITEEQVESLRAEAGSYGDTEMVSICDRALSGESVAWARCEHVIREAAAQDEKIV